MVEYNDLVGTAAPPDFMRYVTANHGGSIGLCKGTVERLGKVGCFVLAKDPAGEQDRVAVGAARRIRVLVAPNRHASVAGGVDELDHGMARAPIVRPFGLQV